MLTLMLMLLSPPATPDARVENPRAGDITFFWTGGKVQVIQRAPNGTPVGKEQINEQKRRLEEMKKQETDKKK